MACHQLAELLEGITKENVHRETDVTMTIRPDSSRKSTGSSPSKRTNLRVFFGIRTEALVPTF
jgi:hypothetical protein